ncbi:hypothetical protein DY000_02015724 [Brassica cretica]|uniref:Uncharacterized protein n=1 Tax=Brassica cretica TaxID=69181 RepID=A0ABQ7D374_BRACR|nr:hypothetical protein DY000_02015724 [Brassica cretica]
MDNMDSVNNDGDMDNSMGIGAISHYVELPRVAKGIPVIRSDLEISDEFGAFWRYLEQAPEMTIELDHRSILEEEYRSMFTPELRSTAKRAESPFGHNRLEV